MMFCPRCGSILIPDLNKKIIRCNGCNYKEDKNRSMIIKERLNSKDKIKKPSVATQYLVFPFSTQAI